MRVLRTLLGLELRRLARTSQVYSYILLPALLLLPTGVFAGVVALSLRSPPSVAVPAALPAELPLAHALERQGLAVVPTADPQAAWLAGEVDAAVVAVVRGEGLAGAHPRLERADPAAWTVRFLAVDAALEGKVEEAVERAGDEVLADLVVLAGGDPERDMWLAGIETLPLPEAPPFSIQRALWAYLVFVVSLVGFFLLALAGVADRNEGITESLLAAPVRARDLLLARLLATLGLQALAGLLIAANVVLLLSTVEGVHKQLVTGPATLLSLVGAAAFCDALYLLVGTWTPSAKAANNVGGAVMMGMIGLLGAGVGTAAPAWVPLAGGAAASTGVDHALAGSTCLGLALMLVLATAAAVERRVDLKLAAERR